MLNLFTPLLKCPSLSSPTPPCFFLSKSSTISLYAVDKDTECWWQDTQIHGKNLRFRSEYFEGEKRFIKALFTLGISAFTAFSLVEMTPVPITNVLSLLSLSKVGLRQRKTRRKWRFCRWKKIEHWCPQNAPNTRICKLWRKSELAAFEKFELFMAAICSWST